ncbi:MAG: SMC-Scp complex subunit ScpB [Alphaproteobacteria bacterium]|nr:SMC-Scp complex subunit ScpB [Alphaproteobacteria bacterium]MCZ6845410.1 SMC-Scp complex subunit ScpB [Alphaproteobacteria bacterium]
MIPDTADANAAEHLRVLEAVLFAAVEPLDEASIAARLPDDADIDALLVDLSTAYAGRGVNVVKVGGKWSLRTAPDLVDKLKIEREAERRLSRAGHETLAIIAYHQPLTRAEIESIRGVAVNRGTLDVLLEAGWIRPGRRRNTPGRPTTWVTSEAFLSHFGLESLQDLPGVKELKLAGLLDTRPAVDVYTSRAPQEDLPFESIEAAADAAEEGLEPL